MGTKGEVYIRKETYEKNKNKKSRRTPYIVLVLTVFLRGRTINGNTKSLVVYAD